MAVCIDVTVVKRKEYLTAIIVLNVVVWIILVGTARKDKIIPYRHPLPRMQDIIDSLGKNQYFSLLDQTSHGYQ